MKIGARKGFTTLVVVCMLLTILSGNVFAADTYSATITVNLDSEILANTAITYTLDGGAAQNVSTSASGQLVLTLATGFHRIAVTYDGKTLENAVTDDKPSVVYDFSAGGGTVTYYTVVYKDWDGSFLKALSVASGEASIYGTSPSRAGYSFTNWVLDADTSNDATDELAAVTGELTVRAKYSAATSGFYTLSRGLIYSNGGLWFDVAVTRGSAAQLVNPLLKVTYTTASGQVIVVTPVSADISGNSTGNKVFIPNGATGVSVRLVDGNDASWPTAYKSAALSISSIQIAAGVGN